MKYPPWTLFRGCVGTVFNFSAVNKNVLWPAAGNSSCCLFFGYFTIAVEVLNILNFFLIKIFFKDALVTPDFSSEFAKELHKHVKE